MKKLFTFLVVASLVSCNGGGNSDGNSDISKIEAEQGLKICDCKPENNPLPGNNASKEEREEFEKGVQACIKLQEAVIAKVGNNGWGDAQNNCK